jgi:hypothetical protein
MNGAPKLSALAATALLSLALAACGGGSSTSTTGPSAAATTSAQKKGTTATAAGNGKKAGSGGKKEKSSASHEAKEASEFVPKQHSDSGGGSKQFRAPKGFDNSVQDYGAEASGSDQGEAATVLHNFLDARAEGNWAATCSYMSKSTVESFEKLAAQSKQIEDRGCGEVLEKLTNPAVKRELREEAAQADVGSLRVEGDRAFIIYRGLNKAVIAIPMTKEGGSWKVAGLSGTPLN